MAQSDFEKGRKLGQSEGLIAARKEALDFLQHKYIDAPDRPDRGTPEADAILSLAGQLSDHLKERSGNQG
jgi:hypothetical protein